jgi:hypothetical protein
VELYDGTGAFVSAAVTDGSGAYAFTGLAAGDYVVRVVSGAVTSSRSGYVAGLLPVLTFRTDGATGSAVEVTDHVGGQVPSAADPDSGTSGTTMNPATGAFTAGLTGTAHSIAPVTLGGSDVTGVDFGFCFDAVVNAGDAGQGSLRQFLANADALAGDASLAQAGLVAGKENAVWMISNGTAAAGLRAANDYFSGGVATVGLASALPAVSTPVVLDARKQPGWSAAPVVKLDGASAGAGVSGLTLSGAGGAVSGLHIAGFSRHGVVISAGGGSSVTASVITGNGGKGVVVSATAGNAVPGSSIYGNTGLGLDLGDDGVTSNNGTTDAGLPNNDMDYPVFTTAVLGGTSLFVSGYVGSAPGQATFAAARVEIFKSDGHSSGHGGGSIYLGFLTADGSGNVNGALDVTGKGLAVSDKITGTATDGSSNTSEFGANVTVAAPSIVKRAFLANGTPLASGAVTPRGTTVKFLLYINNPGGAVADVRVQDVLDAAFEYQAGSIQVDNSVAACAALDCTAPEEAAILAAVSASTPLTDAVDGDVASYTSATRTVDAGSGSAANAQLNIAAGKVWAMLVKVKVR